MKRWFIRQKYRYDLGVSYLNFITLLMATLAASDTIARLSGLQARVVLPLIAVGSLAGVWLLGLIADALGFQRALQDEFNARNRLLVEVHEAVCGSRKDSQNAE